MPMSARCACLLLALCCCTASLIAQEPVREDWPWFLGPRHDGISAETGLLPKWPEAGPPVVWEMEVGTGYSAPSIRDGKLVLHHRLGGEEIIDCFDALTAKPLWRHSCPSGFSDPYGYNNGPRCTPLLTEDRCYTLGAEGKLICLSLADGSRIWIRDLQQDFEIPDGFFGVGATPILEGNVLIVLVGGQPNSGVVGFDAATGKTLWESVGRKTWDGVKDEDGEVQHWTGDEMVVSYSSPIAADFHGRRHILCLMRHGLVSVDPQTGEELFKYWFRSRVHESVNAARPVVVGDTILLSSAYRVGAALLRVKPDGRSYEVVWRDPRNLLTHWSTATPLDGHFYGFSGRHEREGELRCIRAEDGVVVWATTGWEGPLVNLAQDSSTGDIVDKATGKPIPWPFYGRGSATFADGRLIVLGERGTLALVKPSPDKWVEVSRWMPPRMKYPCWTAPVLAQGRLYLRCEDALVCLDLRASPAKAGE